MNCSRDSIGSVQHPAHLQSVRKLRLIDADEFFAEAEAEEQHVLEMERERCSTTKRDDHVYNAIARLRASLYYMYPYNAHINQAAASEWY